MRNHTDCNRGFYWSTKSWYNRTNLYHEVTFGMYHSEGGTSGEMTMHWVDLAGRKIAKLESFEDSWSALSLFTDLIEKMGELDEQMVTEEEFVELLLSLGFKDLTQYDNPYA